MTPDPAPKTRNLPLLALKPNAIFTKKEKKGSAI